MQHNHEDGTYVAFELSPASRLQVDDFITNTLKLENPIHPDYLHTTVIYSHTPVPHAEYLDPKTTALALTNRYEVFVTKTGKHCLTAIVDCPRARELNDMLTRLGATSSFTPYLAHLTLSYDYTGDIASLPLIPFQLYYSDLLVKPLDPHFIPPPIAIPINN